MGMKLPGAVAPGSLIDGDFVVAPPGTIRKAFKPLNLCLSVVSKPIPNLTGLLGLAGVLVAVDITNITSLNLLLWSVTFIMNFQL